MPHSCSLHTYLTLPSQFFLDRYQLSDPLFLSSQKLRSLRSLSGETDLEAPDWVVSRWGSAALIELASAPESGAEGKDTWTASIPLHLRYLSPRDVSDALQASATGAWPDGWTSSAKPNSTVSAPFPWPPVFWACAAESGDEFTINPFDRTNLGYDGLFGRQAVFYHVEPETAEGETMMTAVNIPVMDTKWAGWVELGTVLAICLGTLWLFWKLGQVVFKGQSTTAAKEERKRK